LNIFERYSMKEKSQDNVDSSIFNIDNIRCETSHTLHLYENSQYFIGIFLSYHILLSCVLVHCIHTRTHRYRRTCERRAGFKILKRKG